MEGAGEAPTRPCPTNSVYESTRPTRPVLPPATHAPCGLDDRRLSPPLSKTRGAHHRGEVLQQERPDTPLLLLVLMTRGDPEPVLGVSPTHLYGSAPVSRPPLPAPDARDGVHAFLRLQEVGTITGVHLVRLPPASPDEPGGPGP